jgi:hypothetical protein
MKKFVVLLAVVAMTLVFGAIAYAEVTVGGELAIRSRDFSNMDLNDDAADTSGTQQRDTQTRIKLDVNAKVGDVKGKLELWNDWETWGSQAGPSGTFETQPGATIRVREAWVSFNLPSIPVNVTAGHQLLTLGNGWFFRSMHFGSDAWVVANQTGNNTAAFVNVKFGEGSTQSADDTDAYVILDVFKLSDSMTIGADFTDLKNRTSDFELQNIGVNFNGKLGPVALKAEVDFQMGGFDNGGPDFAGNQVVVQGTVPVDPVTINFTVARGSGDDDPLAGDVKTFQNALDTDPHYTFLYEYKMNQAGGTTKNFGFSNTTALGVGATFAATKSLTIGADFWWLQATEKGALPDDQIGQEIDVKLNWNLAQNLSWNWVAGMFMPGDAYGTNDDNATGIQGILALKF